jgi:hypothetical protein
MKLCEQLTICQDIRPNDAVSEELNLNDFFSTGTGPGTHLAVDYEDTSEGAVHCFQDEFGNWHSYTFGQVCLRSIHSC